MKTFVLITFTTLLAALSSAVAADAPATFKVSEFTFTRPDSWSWVETTSAMRKAQLKVTGADKSTAEVVFFFFGAGGAGGTQANIDRWLSQFQEPREKLNSKTEQIKAGGRNATLVQAEGTYLSGMPGGAKTAQANAMLLGAILESDEGNVFVRMTGPAKLVKESQPQFRKLIETAKTAQ